MRLTSIGSISDPLRLNNNAQQFHQYQQTDNQLASQPIAIEKTQTVKSCVGNPDPALG